MHTVSVCMRAVSPVLQGADGRHALDMKKETEEERNRKIPKDKQRRQLLTLVLFQTIMQKVIFVVQ